MVFNNKYNDNNNFNSNNSLAVIGAQWGDEGKGKVVDYLTARANLVARFQGGNNAGHTVIVGEDTFKMHHLPVGLLYPQVFCLLGNGMVISPGKLVEEIESLQERGFDISYLRISPKAHVILPFHRAMDNLLEEQRGNKKIGTTGLGIGPAYADKAYRCGLRVADFIDGDRFAAWLDEYLPLQNLLLEKTFDHDGFSREEVLTQYQPLAEKLAPYVEDVSAIVMDYLQKGKRVLFEGSQGTLLDIDHGTYPFVTSSSTVAGAIPTGLGIGPRYIKDILGVIKAYTTRVGEGPFPTEETGEMGDYMRRQGGEFGTTTGRPRRCGWLDAVIAAHTVQANSLNGWAVTKLDVLSGLETVKIATAYRINGQEETRLPVHLDDFVAAEPVYKELPGWQEDLSSIREYDQLPAAARKYLETIAEITDVPIAFLSVGPEREQTIIPPGSLL